MAQPPTQDLNCAHISELAFEPHPPKHSAPQPNIRIEDLSGVAAYPPFFPACRSSSAERGASKRSVAADKPPPLLSKVSIGASERAATDDPASEPDSRAQGRPRLAADRATGRRGRRGPADLANGGQSAHGREP